MTKLALELSLPARPSIGGGGAGAAPASYLLDTMTNAARAYSTRKLRSAYAGSALRVRRSSDSAEQDIGFSGENLDTSALTTFVGANNGFVVTMYDQSGNADHATQATAANQPKIVNAGTAYTTNSKARLQPYVAATNSQLNASSSLSFKEVNAVGGYDISTYSNYAAMISISGSDFLLGVSTGTTYFTAWGNTYINNVNTATTPMSGIVHQDRATSATGSTGTLALCSRDNLYSWIGPWCEAMVWTAQLSGGDATTLYNNQKAYWGTP